tara:strand:+ start:250 stop:1938 length:1689 start_codon:yes stop_codon:yes gene_type:complete
MVKSSRAQHWYTLPLTLMALLLLAIPVCAAELLASVDRKEITKSDVVTLQVRYTGNAGFSSPEWSGLDKSFDIINQNRSMQFNMANGSSTSYTEWTLSLAPKSTGKLTIPAFIFDNSRSEPITVNVTDSPKATNASNEEFYFQVEVSGGTHYVQEQLLYIEKLFYTVNHEDPSLSEFAVTDAQVQALGEPKQYITVVDGQRIGVYERRYAIFPEVAGELVIPGQRFSGRISNRYDRFNRGRTATIVSKPIKLNVQPIPKDYPQAPWLPASNLKIEENFSKDEKSWKVGEPVTRSFKITADGISGSQIPPIPTPEVSQLRYYPDQTNQDTQMDENGLHAAVAQSVALVPTTAGRIVLPELRIPWWNTRLNTVEYAVLPARTIHVAEAVSSIPAPITAPQDLAVNSADVVETNTTSGIWPWICALLVISNIGTLALLWFLRTRPTGGEITPRKQGKKETSVTVDGNWKEVRIACQSSSPKYMRDAILRWAPVHFNDPSLLTMDQLIQHYQDPKVKAALAELDAQLYSQQENSAFNGNALLTLLKKEDPSNKKKNTKEGLAPLYP